MIVKYQNAKGNNDRPEKAKAKSLSNMYTEIEVEECKSPGPEERLMVVSSAVGGIR